MKYEIIKGDSTADLEAKVTSKLGQGWKLQGGVGVYPFEDFYDQPEYKLVQAMYLEDILSPEDSMEEWRKLRTGDRMDGLEGWTDKKASNG